MHKMRMELLHIIVLDGDANAWKDFHLGPNGPKVGFPVRLLKVICLPTSEPFGPGKSLSKQPEIVRTIRILPKFFSGD